MGGIREVVAVIVAADSATGRVVAAIDELTAHLPAPGRAVGLPTVLHRVLAVLPVQHRCPSGDGRRAAASRLDTERPPRPAVGKPKPRSPAPPAPRPQAAPQSDTWFDEESPDG
jgi:hypothetical protein